jgi:hypothetical protein
MYAVLALAKGANTTAEDVHNAWCAWMADREPSHESLVPFAQLSTEHQQQDLPFVQAIAGAVAAHASAGVQDADDAEDADDRANRV